MEKKLVQEMINAISPELTWLLFQFILITLIFFMVKDFLKSMTNYIGLRFSLWGLNTKMLINGKIGYIKNITFKDVVFELSDEDATIYIPIPEFLTMTKIVYHNGSKNK